ncbi:hypothetical protein C6376_42995 [Streptomyces sp. P3]|nr:hypothetical protein C6376_42995 [Streptomyces sp. P3]
MAVRARRPVVDARPSGPPPEPRRFGASGHRGIGASGHRGIGASGHRGIGASGHRQGRAPTRRVNPRRFPSTRIRAAAAAIGRGRPVPPHGTGPRRVR